MAKIISIETSTEVCSVALGVDGRLVSLRQSEGGRNHASELGVFVDEVLRLNDLEVEDLDAVALSAGPGSYTGLRIGTALAKGLCYGGSLPLVAVGSLEALAHSAYQEYQAGILLIEDPSSALLIPMIDARRMEVYTQVYDLKLTALTDVNAKIIDGDSFSQYTRQEREMILLGDGAAKCYDLLHQANPNVKVAKIYGSAGGMVTLAQEKFLARDFVDVAYWEPTYLKDFMITTTRKKLF